MSITNCTILTAIITERIGNHYHVYSKFKDFVLEVNKCPADYAVGKWLSLEIEGNVLKSHTTCYIENAPESRVINGKTQILTYGSFIREENGNIIKCNTVDFAIVCILPNVDISNVSMGVEYAIWTRRLDNVEEEVYSQLCGECLKWGILSITGQVFHHFETRNSKPSLLPWPTSYVTLEGIVTGISAKQSSGKYLVYVWTLFCQPGMEGIIVCHDSPDSIHLNIGQWLHFGLPKIEYDRTLGSKALNQPRFQIENGDYILIEPRVITRNVRKTLEVWQFFFQLCKINSFFLIYISTNYFQLDIPNVTIPENHILGADFWHAEVGWISDPLNYLRPGIILDATVVRHKPRSDYYSTWKLIKISNMRNISSSHSLNEVDLPLLSRTPFYPATSIPNSFIHTIASSQAANLSLFENLPESAVALPKKATATVKKINNQFMRRESENASLKKVTCEISNMEDQLTRQMVQILPTIKNVHLERAMVEFYDNNRKCMFLWLIDSHQDSVFFSTSKLEPGHCFEGEFTFDNIEKKVYTNVKFNNQRNGNYFEAYNDFFGLVLDSYNLLFMVTREIEVPVTIKKLLHEDRFVWQIILMLLLCQEQNKIIYEPKQELVDNFSKVMNNLEMRDVINRAHPTAYKVLSKYYKRE
uniref:CST complex subunit CTC1 n=1 Tax=Heterorhabditis bacteriophora TaxID=37862 RepID=A0A1I7XIF6_HETBA